MKASETSRSWRVAVTGGIGCGKTEAAQMLQALGAAVWDADESVHRLLRRGTESITGSFAFLVRV